VTLSAILLYVDPGSGSYLVQMIIAAVVGFLFYFKSAWWRIRSFFTRKKQDRDSNKSY
jgi:hypothetical protein